MYIFKLVISLHTRECNTDDIKINQNRIQNLKNIIEINHNQNLEFEKKTNITKQ